MSESDVQYISSPTFIPKCGSSSNSCKFNYELCSTLDQRIVHRIMRDYPGKILRCRCQNASCGLKKLFREEFSKKRKSSSTSLISESLREDLLKVAGGSESYETVYSFCENLSKSESQVYSTSEEGNTVLMELCVDRKIPTPLLNSQILSFITLYLNNAPSLLFIRNSRGFNAMELASLSNKTQVSAYLASLYALHGRDPNEANPMGHTVLHTLARKGDECSNTLKKLLSLRDENEGRILRHDLINVGGKTPFDVVNACTDIFSHDKSLSYTETSRIFRKAIEEDSIDF